jgi:hypothetical protein
MTIFEHAFGDKRRAAAVARLEQSMVERSSIVVRQLGGTRAGEMSAHRVLSSSEVTPAKILACIGRRTGAAVAGCRVVAAQDTTEINFPGRTRTRLGPAGRTGDPPGFFIHAMVAVDADTEAVLGLVDAQIWTRAGGALINRRCRTLEDKEARRWLRSAEAASMRLASAREVIVIGDRESDIYALFARRPAGTHLVVRAAQNRALGNGGLLFDAARPWPLLARQEVRVASRRPGDPGRAAEIELRGGEVALRHPRHGRHEGNAPLLMVTLVEAEERCPPPGVEPLHWRLLTTLPGDEPAAAAEVVRLYRLRWRIEQCFRMLKSDGVRLEETQTIEPHRLFNLAMLATNAAVRIVQLVDARDGSSRPAEDVADATEIAAALALCSRLEGKTERQKNPHPAKSLSWLSWIVARLGGWNCYYKPPGPKTMRRGWDRLAAIAEGYALASPALQDV